MIQELKAARRRLDDLGETITDRSFLSAVMLKVPRSEYESTIESLMSDNNLTIQTLQSRFENRYKANKEERKKHKRVVC